MNITLRAGERIYINGAVIRVDRKATLELLNDATFLLETHVIQAKDANTPLRQIYFVVQVMLMDPATAKNTHPLANALIEKATSVFDAREIRDALKTVAELIGRGRYYEAMKSLRGLYPLERREMFPDAETAPAHAA